MRAVFITMHLYFNMYQKKKTEASAESANSPAQTSATIRTQRVRWEVEGFCDMKDTPFDEKQPVICRRYWLNHIGYGYTSRIPHGKPENLGCVP